MSASAHMERRCRRSPRLRRLALLMATALLALATARMAGLWLSPPPLPVLDTLGGDFRLQSTRGDELSLESLRGRLVLLNFGYTACPDVCPTVLARLRALLLDLEALGIEPQPLFVTLDPERDDLDTLTRYVTHFHSELVGLRGTQSETAAAAGLYQVFYEREPGQTTADYQLSHSVHIYLIDTAGRVRATFGGDVPLPDMVAAVRRLAREEGV